jgi:ABC-type lipoprotein export system ATPase subunit
MAVNVSKSVSATGALTSDILVQVDDVFKIYRAADEETVALRGVSLQVNSSEFVALVGRSGSGKSTLLHLIAGLDTPSAGSIIINGTNIGRLDEERRAAMRRQKVGLVLQRDNLIPYLTARENVALPLLLAGQRGAEQRASDLLERVGLGHRVSHRASELSGGEQQRVSIAVALALSPQLLLADELTGELDAPTATGILDLLVDLQQKDGLALLVVTHDPSVAERAGHVLVMRDGVIVADE